MEMLVTPSYVGQILKELKRQLRHIERAIAALEAIEREQPKTNVRRERRTRLEQPDAMEKKNGTTGEVVPFVRPN